jgi:hypothetical protein
MHEAVWAELLSALQHVLCRPEACAAGVGSIRRSRVWSDGEHVAIGVQVVFAAVHGRKVLAQLALEDFAAPIASRLLADYALDFLHPLFSSVSVEPRASSVSECATAHHRSPKLFWECH